MGFSFFKKNNKNQADDASLRGISEAIDQFQSAPQAWNTSTMGDEEDTEARILGRLLASVETGGRKPGTNVRKMRWWPAAAAILLLCVVAAFYEDNLLDKMYRYPQVVAEAKAAHREKVTLPDGSIVFLNAGSRLSYPQQFSRRAREVTLLEGEAYFDIQQDAKRPFIVNSGKINTTVLGTTFNIRAYHFISNVTITVSSGKVAVNKQDEKSYVLTPDQQLNYAVTGDSVEVKQVSAADVLGWMDGKLVFANENFGQVAGLLENKYNTKIVFDEEALKAYHFTASFEATETLNDVLDALTLTKGLQYEERNNVIHIYTSKK